MIALDPRIGVWELRALVDKKLPDDIMEWPARVQDKLMEAAERNCKTQVGWTLHIVSSRCYAAPPFFYAHLVVQEFPPFAEPFERKPS